MHFLPQHARRSIERVTKSCCWKWKHWVFCTLVVILKIAAWSYRI